MYRSPGKIFLPGGQLNTYAAQTIAWRKQFADFFCFVFAVNIRQSKVTNIYLFG